MEREKRFAGQEALPGRKEIFIPTKGESQIPLLSPEIPVGDSRGANDKEVKSHAPLYMVETKYNKDYPRDASRCEVHRWRGEIWYHQDGDEFIMEVGGTLTDPYLVTKGDKLWTMDILSKDVRGTRRVYRMKPGDQLYIPEGIPHMHYTKPNEAARLLFVKVPALVTVPIHEVPGWVGSRAEKEYKLSRAVNPQ